MGAKKKTSVDLLVPRLLFRDDPMTFAMSRPRVLPQWLSIIREHTKLKTNIKFWWQKILNIMHNMILFSINLTSRAETEPLVMFFLNFFKLWDFSGRFQKRSLG